MPYVALIVGVGEADGAADVAALGSLTFVPSPEHPAAAVNITATTAAPVLAFVALGFSRLVRNAVPPLVRNGGGTADLAVFCG